MTKEHLLYCQQISVVNIIPSVLIDKKNITSARSHKLRFEPRSTTQLLSNQLFYNAFLKCLNLIGFAKIVLTNHMRFHKTLSLCVLQQTTQKRHCTLQACSEVYGMKQSNFRIKSTVEMKLELH